MKFSRTAGIILIIAINIAVDQISKFWVRANFTYGEIKQLIGDTFIMQYVENKGAFLGLGSDMNDTLRLLLLLILPALVLGYLIYYLITNKALDKLSLFAFCCIAGGGISNVFDRIVHNQVTDYFYIYFNDTIKTGIFNIADMSVTFGMLILLYTVLFRNKNKLSQSA